MKARILNKPIERRHLPYERRGLRADADPQLAEIYGGELRFDPRASERASGRWSTWEFVPIAHRGGIESASYLSVRTSHRDGGIRFYQDGCNAL
jgi:hypothetical protein